MNTYIYDKKRIMLTCMARPKLPTDDQSLHKPDDNDNDNFNGACKPNSKQYVKSLTSQIKDMALKASGAYRCNSCTTPVTTMLQKNDAESTTTTTESSASERFRSWSYRRTGSKNSSSGRVCGKELEARLKGISSGEGTPPTSGRRVEPIVMVQENEPEEWVAQVESGVLITFVSLPRGGNDLKRIRFSRDMYNKWQAQRWWTENYDKVMELYNVQRLNQQAFPLPIPPRSEDEMLKIDSIGGSPITPPLSREPLPRTTYRPTGMGYSSSETSIDPHPTQVHSNTDSCGLTATPKLSSITGAKTETSSMDASIRTSSSREADRSGDFSISNASDLDNEWVEEDEPGVYITIRAFSGGSRELRRVRFSREKFGEIHARLWWEENRARIHKTYL